MFFTLGRRISRHRLPLLAGWMAAVALAVWLAPPMDAVVEDGEFAFLPVDAPSRRAEQLFQQAFPHDLLDSSIVIVVRRATREQGLHPKDLEFVDDGTALEPSSQPRTLRQHIEAVARAEGGLAKPSEPSQASTESQPSIISGITTYQDKRIGRLLLSEDRKATLVIVELTTEFLENRNAATIQKIEDLLFSNPQFRRQVPPGLDLWLSGDAVVGRDMLAAARDSARATELWTVALVVIPLLAIYRAPFLALIPLVTVFLAVALTMSLLTLLARAGLVVLFEEIQSYITVLLYGAGVDYCLFLIARYREELDGGSSYAEGLTGALGKVGPAISASAATVVCGIGMMVFAEFGKFRQAGIAISLGLVIVLLASLTFAPILLRLAGRWAFWPYLRSERVTEGGWIPAGSLLERLAERGVLQQTWDKIGQALLRSPGTIWLTSIALMIPLAVVGAVFHSHLSYGLLTDLPPHAPSVVGAEVVQEHFPAGITGQITVLIRNDQADFTRWFGDNAALPIISRLTRTLDSRKGELELAAVRSAVNPLGRGPYLDAIENPITRKAYTIQSLAYYVSHEGELANHVTRLDLIAEVDPFARHSVRHLRRLEEEIRASLPAEFTERSQILIKGPTAQIRDLKSVTDRDQLRIDLLVTAGVFVILVLLLRRPAICLYLVVGVLFSYLVTLGATFAFFWMLDPAGFSGLDWKVPVFLFTILIAVGEDYNIFLMTRIEEEQAYYGAVPGIAVALARTGKIISSCGIIMAGTFASLTAGSLMGLTQLGFALAFGVLLDTFVVRPVLVPAYLILLYQGRFGRLGRLLGAGDLEISAVARSLHSHDDPTLDEPLHHREQV